jgi:hypothetical protein
MGRRSQGVSVLVFSVVAGESGGVTLTLDRTLRADPAPSGRAPLV